LINNRQGGRRRGRGGQRGQNLGGQPGNRQDNRQRGNAAQLLEKYKNMARDSQLSGDRVQTEYYLQFADHYFRVLGESRSRFEDQRRSRDDDLDDDEGDEDQIESSDEQDNEGDEPRDRGERYGRRDREPRPARSDRAAAPARDNPGNAPRSNGDAETIPFDALPPAIGSSDGNEAEQDSGPRRPRRRTRAPRTPDGDGEVAPAA
jgi:hypothetical protein